ESARRRPGRPLRPCPATNRWSHPRAYTLRSEPRQRSARIPGGAGAIDHRMGWPAMSAAPPMSGSVGDGLHSRYRTLWGGVDEMLDADGNLRPVWRRFVHMLDGLTG